MFFFVKYSSTADLPGIWEKVSYQLSSHSHTQNYGEGYLMCHAVDVPGQLPLYGQVGDGVHVAVLQQRPAGKLLGSL